MPKTKAPKPQPYQEDRRLRHTVKSVQDLANDYESLRQSYVQLLTHAGDLHDQKVKLVNTMQKLVDDLDALIAESEGVYGLHRNGDGAPWGELTKGGRFEEWLSSLDDARDVLAEVNPPDETQSTPSSG